MKASARHCVVARLELEPTGPYVVGGQTLAHVEGNLEALAERELVEPIRNDNGPTPTPVVTARGARATRE
jgi:hypothetical protein